MASASVWIWLAIGIVAGLIAWRIVSPGRPVWRSLIAGVLGSVIGGIIATFAGAGIPIEPEILKHALLSIVGAVVIVLLAKVIA